MENFKYKRLVRNHWVVFFIIGHILSLYTWGGAMFVSGSQDRTIRFWDLRTRGCVNLIPSPSSGTGAVKGRPSNCIDTFCLSTLRSFMVNNEFFYSRARR